MSAAHTPGPWSMSAYIPYEGHASARYYIYGHCGDSRSPTVAHIKNSTKQPMEANARLIAAAPELLDALRRAAQALAHACEASPGLYLAAYELAAAAIAKATQP